MKVTKKKNIDSKDIQTHKNCFINGIMSVKDVFVAFLKILIGAGLVSAWDNEMFREEKKQILDDSEKKYKK